MPPPPVAKPSPSQADYMVGWICIIPEEYYAALAVLDEQYDSSHIVPGQGDRTSYVLGRMGEHAVVINVPAATHYGELHASTTAKNMKSTFARIRFVLLVGIGGGIPLGRDLRLGDVVLGTRVIPYAFGKETDYGFVRTGQILSPPQTLLTAITGLEGRRRSRAIDLSRRIESIGDRYGSGQSDYTRPSEDRLYELKYQHEGRDCDCLKPKAELISKMHPREQRRGDLVRIHQGNIGTASVVMKNADVRDRLARQENLVCFEMEATGVMSNVACLPIRGVSDYADGHKNDAWQPYAALAAAVCAKELLAAMSPKHIIYSPLELDGLELENYVTGAIASPSRHGDDVHLIRQKMEALMDRHELVEERLAPELDKLKDTSRADLKEVRDKVKGLEGLQEMVKNSLRNLTVQVEEHMNLHLEKDFVTREEWLELKMQVDRNTSKVEDLCNITQGALTTTEQLLGDLSGRLDNPELAWFSKWAAYANQYYGHLANVARAFNKDKTGRVAEDHEQITTTQAGTQKHGTLLKFKGASDARRFPFPIGRANSTPSSSRSPTTYQNGEDNTGSGRSRSPASTDSRSVASSPPPNQNQTGLVAMLQGTGSSQASAQTNVTVPTQTEQVSAFTDRSDTSAASTIPGHERVTSPVHENSPLSENSHQPTHPVPPANRNLEQTPEHNIEEGDPSKQSLSQKISKFGGGGGGFRKR
ncbi:hypothetical protein ANOM_011765 [Aspergillus nomiae NRRL 13137]|uniref:Uncharacterized protein n=1 Tax=Aspergillus nomiae NRRL (strain ATCC 15546 / NRRL 13137 / CBS 260.88 / M93) TaxID=1509407 RepID=A0A0L1ILN7_ASPN3|nr:uncharacterized protein ANOM_011765 [Aspergillus nomiae NRRL 13137]KNG80113.1 hypothetical protein ANOM_011765 [Aspergillus nomiae NRRL 13137]